MTDGSLLAGPVLARSREDMMLFGLALPGLLWILVIVALPVLYLSSLSLFDEGGALSFENYARIAGSPLYRGSFVITFEISLAVTGLCIVLGYPLCYWMWQLSARSASLAMICVLLPFWTAVLVRTYAWLALLQRNGVVNKVLLALGVIETPLALVHNLTGSIIGMVHVMLPFLVLPLYATMKEIDRDLIRAAIGLGAAPRRAFWTVFVPMSMPGLFAGVVLVFVLSLGFYVTPALLGGGRVQMLAQRIEGAVTLYSNWGAASALGVVLLTMTLALIWLVNRIFGLDKLLAR